MSTTKNLPPQTYNHGKLFSLIGALILVAVLQLIPSQCDAIGTSFLFRIRMKDPMQVEYDLINKLLVEHLLDDIDPEENLFLALSWLKVATGEMSRDEGPQVLPNTQALIQFTSLLKLLDQEQPLCDLVGLDIIKRNEQACGTSIAAADNDIGPLRKIEQIVHQVGLTHARLCRYNYPAKFLKLKATTKLEILDDITTMLNAIIETSKNRVFTHNSVRQLDKRYILKEKSKGVTVQGRDEVVALLRFMAEKTRDDPRSKYLAVVGDPLRRNKWIVDEAMVRQLMDSYVFNRCDYMKRAYGRVLEPASYEQQFYDRDHQYRAINFENGEIMIWLQYYRLCKDMLDDKDGLAKKVVKQIWAGPGANLG